MRARDELTPDLAEIRRAIALLLEPGAVAELRVAAPLVLTAGERNDRLTRLGGALRRYGVGPEAIRECLVAINRHHARPPIEEAEVAKIAASVARYTPAAVFTPFAPFYDSLTDELVARALKVRG